MTDLKETPKTVPAILFFVFLVIYCSLTESNYISPTISLWLFGVTISLGLLVVVGEIEDLLGKRGLEFRGFGYACAALGALVVYVARIDSIDDVNQIFHIDASALPLTVWAGTAMHVMRLSFWVLILALAIASLRVMAEFSSKNSDEDSLKRTAGMTCNLAIIISCALGAGVIHFQLDTDSRKAKLYRIAQSADFSGSFRCINHPQQGMVGLFIGPEQRRILLARKIEEPVLFGDKAPPFFRKIEIPEEFLIVDCISPASYR